MNTRVRYRLPLSAAGVDKPRGRRADERRRHRLTLREPVTRSIEVAVLPELACMSRLLGRAPANRCLTDIHRRLREHLDRVEELIVEGAIQPWRRVRLCREDVEPPMEERPIRLGIYPVSANPLHWGHLLAGLSAIVTLGLDKVVYAVAEDNRCADVMPEELRLCATRELLTSFEPLFCYYPISRETEYDGGSSLFSILELNSGQKIDAFYLAEADGSLRDHPVMGVSDTIRKLENGIIRRIYSGEHGEGTHSLSIVFLDGQERNRVGDSFLPQRHIPSPLPTVSSNRIRDVLRGEHNPDVLAALPFTVFQYAQGLIKGERVKMV